MLRTAALTVLLTAALAPAASATDVSIWNASLVVGSDPGASAMTLRLAPAPGGALAVAVHDDGTVLQAQEGCTALGEHDVACVLPVASLNAQLGGGDDVLTVLGAEPGTDWSDIRLKGGSGNDRLDLSGVDRIVPDTPGGTRYSRIGGGDGDDVIDSGGFGGDVLGNGGDDVIHAGAGSDDVNGGGGADELYGDAGDDDVKADADDTVVDGGEGDDHVAANGAEEVACGAGDDRVSFAYEDAPGTLADSDCEDSDDATLQPTRKGTTWTYYASCSDVTDCNGELRLRWHGRVVATTRVAHDAKTFYVPVTLQVPKALERAVRRKPQLLAYELRGYRVFIDEVDTERSRTIWWRVRAGRP